MTRRNVLIAGWLCALLAGPGASRILAQQDPSVLKAVQYLRQSYNGQGTGEAALIALALLKADVPPSDPALAACLSKIKARFGTGGGYEPQRGAGQGAYEAGATAMALASEDPVGNRGRLEAIVQFLLATQNGNGSWDYAHRSFGDTSITQYAVLGLWESENCGVRTEPVVWERIANWLMSTQCDDGAWVYHKDENSAETCAMTAAALGSLLIAHRQLEGYRDQSRGTSPLLKNLAPDSTANYKPGVSFPKIEQTVRRGMGWISAHFTTKPPTSGPSPYYMLYGIERMGALANSETIGRLDWFPKGRAFIHATQGQNGGWSGSYGDQMNTCWAIFFLTKSTAKTLKRIKLQPKLGAGTLLGGRGLPKDLTSMTIAGGRVVSRPMNGAIEGMLDVLEDPRAQQADSAAAGLVDRYYREGPSALRPHKSRFRKMLSDRDPGVRRVAAWAMAHTGDMDAVPALIDALMDPDEDVVDAARLGLQVISRKIEGLGPPSSSTPEQRREAAARWRDWYNAIKPLDLDEDEQAPASQRAAKSGGGGKP